MSGLRGHYSHYKQNDLAAYAMPTSNFQPIRLLDLDCCYEFTYLMANSADPDQLTSEAN